MTLPRAGIFASARHATGGGGITGTFQAAAGSTANSSTYTFTSQPLGAAAAGRRIVIGVATRATSQSVSSVTVGGVSLSRDAFTNVTHNAEIWSGVVASGTTGDVVVSMSVADSYCGVGVWSLTGGAATGNTATASNTGTPALTVTTLSGDFVVGVLAYEVTSAGPSVAWTAASERYDTDIDGRLRQHSGADLVASGASTDMGATITNYSGTMSGVAAAYR